MSASSAIVSDSMTLTPVDAGNGGRCADGRGLMVEAS